MLPSRRPARIATASDASVPRSAPRGSAPDSAPACAKPRAPDEDAERQLTARFLWLDPKDLQQRIGAAGDRLRQLAGERPFATLANNT